MTDSTREYLHNVTEEVYDIAHGKANDRNSSVTAYKWRAEMDFGRVRTIDNSCMDVYSTMGFRPYLDEEEVANKLPTFDEFSDSLYRTQDVS